MPYTVIGWGEDLDAAGATVNITALADDTVSTNADLLSIPQYSNIAWAAAGMPSGGTSVATLISPSLDQLGSLPIFPTNGSTTDGDAEVDDPPLWMDLLANPRAMVSNEQAQVTVNSNSGAAAFHWALLGLSDGPLTPINVPGVFTVRGTHSTTLTARAWSSFQITLDDQLPVGRYLLCGVLYVAASAIAIRFIDRETGNRPGALAADTTNSQNKMCRFGSLGPLLEFDSVSIPHAEALQDLADTSGTIYLDLVRLT